MWNEMKSHEQEEHECVLSSCSVCECALCLCNFHSENVNVTFSHLTILLKSQRRGDPSSPQMLSLASVFPLRHGFGIAVARHLCSGLLCGV